MLVQPSQPVRIEAKSDTPGLGKKQQRFNGLVKKIAQHRELLRAWSDAMPEIHRGIAEYHRLVGEHPDVAGDLVRLLDRMYGDRRLTKAERKRLQAVICEAARDLLAAGGADDLKAIYNRHSRSDFDTEATFEETARTLMMKSVMEEMFGMDFAQADIRSMDELEQAARAQFVQEQQSAERHRQAADERRARCSTTDFAELFEPGAF